VQHNAVEGLRVPRRSRTERFFFSLEEVRRILAAAKEPERTMYWLAAETGMRAGELAALRWADVDLELLTVRVVQSVWRGKVTDSKDGKRCAYVRAVSSTHKPSPGVQELLAPEHWWPFVLRATGHQWT
jgi:hypothetical protein